MGRNLKFPQPKDYKPAEPAVICPAERVIGLYNQDSDDSAQRIAKKVRVWFIDQAQQQGWAGVHFLTEVQSNHGAGCILWRAPEKDITVKVTMELVLSPETQ